MKQITFKPVKKIAIAETLLSIPLGGSMVIKNRDISERSVVGCACVLRRKGYGFTVTVKGRIDDVEVFRTK